MTTPTLIDLPPPPSDPVTPSEIPGTPNSTTTSMSELSTVAIKDGSRGHPHHHSNHRQQASLNDQSDTRSSRLEAERADRISRLAGLERVATVRQTSNASLPIGASATHPQGEFEPPTPTNYFGKERSTVGSASATGSVGGQTTWASGSDMYDQTDKMSEDQDQEMETSSAGGFSDDANASLVGFGEGASSTVSGPVSVNPAMIPPRTPQRQGGLAQPMAMGRTTPPTPTSGVTPTAQIRDARMMDGLTYDNNVVDTAHTGPVPSGYETAEHIMSDRFDSQPGGMTEGEADKPNSSKGLGRFPFEEGR